MNDLRNDSADLTARARHAILWVGSTTIVWQVVSWALTLLTARILLPKDYGILSLTETVAPFLGMLAALNLSTWIVQADRFGDREKASMYSLTSIVGVGMAAVGVALGPLIGAFFENPEMVRPFQVVALTFAVRGTAVVPLASLQRDLNFKPIALMNLIVGVSRGLLQLGLAWLGYGYWALIAGIVYRELAAAIWAHAYVGLQKTFSWDLSLYRKALAFGAPATLALAASVLFKASDKAVIGKLFSIEFLGFYSMAFFLTDLPMAKVNAVLRPVFLPYFARLRTTPDRMRAHFCKFVLAVSSLVFPVLAGLAVVAPLAVGLVLGDKWLPLIGPLQVLCIVGLIRAFVDNVPHLLLALGKPVQVLWIRLFYLVVMPTSFVVLGLTWGVTGIYVTWLVVFPVISSAMLYVLKREAGIRQWDYARNLLAPAASTCFMVLCTYLAMELMAGLFAAGIALVLVIVIGGISYSAFYWAVFRSEATEILRVARGKEA